MKLQTGDKAPEFEVNDQDGNLVKLADSRGKKIVLYFYPKDNTPGCVRAPFSHRMRRIVTFIT